MKKCDLFEILDEQEQSIQYIEALANILKVNIDSVLLSEEHLKRCADLIAELSITLVASQERSSKALSELYLINDSFNGSQD